MPADVTTPDRDISKLHPLLRPALLELFQELGKRKLSVFMTEGFRSPERQGWLYAQGRTREGSIVTYAEPGESYHNLEVAGRPCAAAADFAIWDEDGPWSKSLEWNGSEREWQIFTEAAQEVGLVTLDFEKPHVQLPYAMDALADGRFWPAEVRQPDAWADAFPEPEIDLAGPESLGPGGES